MEYTRSVFQRRLRIHTSNFKLQRQKEIDGITKNTIEYKSHQIYINVKTRIIKQN